MNMTRNIQGKNNSLWKYGKYSVSTRLRNMLFSFIPIFGEVDLSDGCDRVQVLISNIKRFVSENDDWEECLLRCRNVGPACISEFKNVFHDLIEKNDFGYRL
jgi:hypothetical protein